jgi:hypothetical protein
VRTGFATYYVEANGGGNCSFDPTPDDLMVAAMKKAQTHRWTTGLQRSVSLTIGTSCLILCRVAIKQNHPQNIPLARGAKIFRLLIHALAYVLMDHLRKTMDSPMLKSAQFDTLRLNLLKIGALVDESVRRVVIHLPQSFRWAKTFLESARLLAIPIPA